MNGREAVWERVKGRGQHEVRLKSKVGRSSYRVLEAKVSSWNFIPNAVGEALKACWEGNDLKDFLG